MDDEKAPEDQVLDAADDVIETELDRLMIYGAILIVACLALGWTIGWLSTRAAKGAKSAEG